MHDHRARHPQQGRSVRSSCQLESFANDVEDKSTHAPGGLQHTQTEDGHVFSLSARDRSPCLGVRPQVDAELDSLPRAILTSSNVDWDPRAMDFDVEGNDSGMTPSRRTWIIPSCLMFLVITRVAHFRPRNLVCRCLVRCCHPRTTPHGQNGRSHVCLC